MPNLEKNLGTEKRKHLTSLVRKASKKRDWLRLKIEWDTELHEGKLSCCTVVFRGRGHVFSLYTWTKQRRVENYPLSRFDSVEIALFDGKYEPLANQICVEFSEKGYSVRMTKDYTSRVKSLKTYRDK